MKRTHLEIFIARAGISAHYQCNGRIALHRGSRRFTTPYTREDWLGQRPEAERVIACFIADLAVEPRRRGQLLSLFRKLLGNELFWECLGAIHADALVDVGSLVEGLRVRMVLRASAPAGVVNLV
jgi:hypothetical protein